MANLRNMQIYSIQDVIPEKNIVIFSPHFDDVLFTLGGYILELKSAKLLDTKHFHINILFSRSSYLARSGNANFDTSLDRIKLVTGNRLIEDQECINDMLGAFTYDYQIMGENAGLLRGKAMANSDMEFPKGSYDDFSKADTEVFERMKQRVLKWAMQENTALIFPMAIKEPIDHFIVREAGVSIAEELGENAKATFYFQEDKPYGGLAEQNELDKIEDFIRQHQLENRLYAYNPNEVIDLGFKHYISQVEELYREGILKRAEFLKQNQQVEYYLDRICKFKNTSI